MLQRRQLHQQPACDNHCEHSREESDRSGANFEPGAVIQVNGKAQKTVNNFANPTTTLIAKKAVR
jgi:hypothetical protein